MSDDHDRDKALARAVELRERGEAGPAREQLLELAERFPDDAVIAYQTAWVHDVLGLEAQAVPFYERALAGEGLPHEDRHGAFLGLGSTYRVLGSYEEAVRTLRRGLDAFPEDPALRAFLAMALYNRGEGREAVALLLKTLTAAGDDPGVRRYRPAIEYYADDLDAVEPAGVEPAGRDS